MERIILYSSLFCLAYANNNTDPVFKYINNNKTVEDCKFCLSKCCQGTQIILENDGSSSCVDNVYNITKLEDFEVNVFNIDVKRSIINTKKTLKSFQFMYADVFWDEYSSEISGDETMDIFLLEDGSLATRYFNFINQWPFPDFTSKFHCLEVQVSASNGTLDLSSVKLVHRSRDQKFDGEEDVYSELKINVKTSVMLLSSFFLLLTLATYAVLPQKRNLPALMLMTFVTCLMVTFVFRAVQVFTKSMLSKGWCTFVGLSLYFSLWCSFTWMNVMSYDMWLTTSAMFMPRWQPHRTILAKFVWYSLYGFGVPLLLLAFLVGIDFADLKSMPNFIKPHFDASPFCYFITEDERRLYINTPLVIATGINVFFFVMTAVYIWRTSAASGGFEESRNTKADQNRFLVYLKMTLITGVTWVLDVLGAFIYPDHWAWLLADVCNSSIGVFIFWSFVCKREILVLLCKRFDIKTSVVRQWESTMVTSVSVSKRQMSHKEAGHEQKQELFNDTWACVSVRPEWTLEAERLAGRAALR